MKSKYAKEHSTDCFIKREQNPGTKQVPSQRALTFDLVITHRSFQTFALIATEM